jgi:hypothetical protein
MKTFRMLVMTERVNACGILVREAVGKWQLGRSINLEDIIKRF